MAEAPRAGPPPERVEEDSQTFAVLSGKLQLHLWVYGDELRDFMKDIEKPGKQKIISNFEEIIEQIDNLIEVQRLCMNMHEQLALGDSVQVVGLPEICTGDKKTLAETLTRLLRTRIQPEAISRFERVGDINPDGAPRDLIVHFFQQIVRKRVLHMADAGLSAIPGYDMPIYIKESLTYMNQKLLRKVRKEARILGINKVWAERGHIFVKRNESASTHEIKCERDIASMKDY